MHPGDVEYGEMTGDRVTRQSAQQHMTITTTLPRVKRLRRKKRVDNITGCPMSGSTIQNSKTAQCKFSKLNL